MCQDFELKLILKVVFFPHFLYLQFPAFHLDKWIFSVWWSPLILNQIFIINTIFSAEYEYDIYFHEKLKIVVQKEDLLCTTFQRALIKQ